ncbi:hypothetical protein TNCT_90581, partial [Trichonephila clavata]
VLKRDLKKLDEWLQVISRPDMNVRYCPSKLPEESKKDELRFRERTNKRLADMEIARKRLISIYEDANVRTLKHILRKKHSPAQICSMDKVSDSTKDVRKSEKSDDSFVTASSDFSSSELSSVTSEEMELAKNIFDERKAFDTTEMDEKYGKPKDTSDVYHEIMDSETDSYLYPDDVKKAVSEPITESQEESIDSDAYNERSISEPIAENQEESIDSDAYNERSISEPIAESQEESIDSDAYNERSISEPIGESQEESIDSKTYNERSISEPIAESQEESIDSDAYNERSISEPVLESQERNIGEDDKKIAQSDTIISKKD